MSLLSIYPSTYLLIYLCAVFIYLEARPSIGLSSYMCLFSAFGSTYLFVRIPFSHLLLFFIPISLSLVLLNQLLDPTEYPYFNPTKINRIKNRVCISRHRTLQSEVQLRCSGTSAAVSVLRSIHVHAVISRASRRNEFRCDASLWFYCFSKISINGCLL